MSCQPSSRDTTLKLFLQAYNVGWIADSVREQSIRVSAIRGWPGILYLHYMIISLHYISSPGFVNLQSFSNRRWRVAERLILHDSLKTKTRVSLN